MLPKVILHNIVSLDGRIDGFIPNLGQFYELASRWKEDATLAGCDTLLAGISQLADTQQDGKDPVSDQRKADDTKPLLVVPDSRGRLSRWSLWRNQPYWRDLVVLCSKRTPISYLQSLQSEHIENIIVGDDHVNLREALEELNSRYGTRVLRVDSGGTLNGALLKSGLVDEISLVIHPVLAGGPPSNSIFRSLDSASEQGFGQLRLIHHERLTGDVVWLRYEVVR